MEQNKLERLQKKYSSKAKTTEGQSVKKGMGGPGRGPGGPGGPGGRGAMPTGKPKNVGTTVKRLFQYIGDEKIKLSIVILCVIGGTVASLAGSYMLRPIINGLTSADGTVNELTSGILMMAGASCKISIADFP